MSRSDARIAASASTLDQIVLSACVPLLIAAAITAAANAAAAATYHHMDSV